MNYDLNQNAKAVGSGIVDGTMTNRILRSAFVWMTLGLGLTGLTAIIMSNMNLALLLLQNSILFWGLCIAELVLVFTLSGAISKMSFPVASGLFGLYSVLNGVTLSPIFLVYTGTSIATTFFVTAGTFGAMALYGFATKRDLTKFGSILMMALIGLIIAMVVNLFLRSGVLGFVISGIGVLIFTGLTAYDVQKIKRLGMSYGDEINDSTQKVALLGALMLYLDFINLFLMLLRFFGNRN